ncbi:DUF6461 domain-containing protein [Streptomyces sp. NPDC057298]|uniref:DUF6461 domain-containing protein n=1 Tax=Streptomyces sp. NPDC057298 TaxID=3346091 RepID=UPI003644E4EC
MRNSFPLLATKATQSGPAALRQKLSRPVRQCSPWQRQVTSPSGSSGHHRCPQHAGGGCCVRCGGTGLARPLWKWSCQLTTRSRNSRTEMSCRPSSRSLIRSRTRHPMQLICQGRQSGRCVRGVWQHPRHDEHRDGPRTGLVPRGRFPHLLLTFVRDLPPAELLTRMAVDPETLVLRDAVDRSDDLGDDLFDDEEPVVTSGIDSPWTWAWEQGDVHGLDERVLSIVSVGTEAVVLSAGFSEGGKAVSSS